MKFGRRFFKVSFSLSPSCSTFPCWSFPKHSDGELLNSCFMARMVLICYYNYVFPKTGSRHIILFATFKNFKKWETFKKRVHLYKLKKKHPDGNFWVEKEYTFEEKMMYVSPRLLWLTKSIVLSALCALWIYLMQCVQLTYSCDTESETSCCTEATNLRGSREISASKGVSRRNAGVG